jgi:hypothetical protein
VSLNLLTYQMSEFSLSFPFRKRFHISWVSKAVILVSSRTWSTSTDLWNVSLSDKIQNSEAAANNVTSLGIVFEWR